MRYFANWPVLDIDMTMSALHAEATEDLAELLEDEGLVAVGEIIFRLDDTNLDGVQLDAEVPVRRFRSERIRRAAA